MVSFIALKDIGTGRTLKVNVEFIGVYHKRYDYDGNELEGSTIATTAGESFGVSNRIEEIDSLIATERITYNE